MPATMTCTAPATTNSARVCRWQTKDAADLIAHRMPATLMVVIKGVESFYWLGRHPYTAGVWCISKESPDGSEPTTYHVNTHGEQGMDWWTCSCPDFSYRRQGRGICKHCRFLAASTAAIGVDPVA